MSNNNNPNSNPKFNKYAQLINYQPYFLLYLPFTMSYIQKQREAKIQAGQAGTYIQ